MILLWTGAAAATESPPSDSTLFLGIAPGVGEDHRPGLVSTGPSLPASCCTDEVVVFPQFNAGLIGELGYSGHPWGGMISFDVSSNAARLRAMGSWLYPVESWKFTLSAGATNYVRDEARFLAPATELEVEWGDTAGALFGGLGHDFFARSGDGSYRADRWHIGIAFPTFRIAEKFGGEFRIFYERQVVTLANSIDANTGALEMGWIKFRIFYGL